MTSIRALLIKPKEKAIQVITLQLQPDSDMPEIQLARLGEYRDEIELDPWDDMVHYIRISLCRRLSGKEQLYQVCHSDNYYNLVEPCDFATFSWMHKVTIPGNAVIYKLRSYDGPEGADEDPFTDAEMDEIRSQVSFK